MKSSNIKSVGSLLKSTESTFFYIFIAGMQRYKLSRIFLFMSLVTAGLLMHRTAMAGDVPVVHISPKPEWVVACKPYNQKPSERLIQNGYFYALTERQIDIDREADYRHTIREIVSEAGIQNGSQITANFDPTYQRLDFHQITVWRDGKPQNRLNVSEFKVLADEQDFSKFIYQGSYSANYILTDIRKGDRIEYSYTLTGRNPVFSDKFCDNIYMQFDQPVAHQYISLSCSSARKLYFKTFNKLRAPLVSNNHGETRYVWENFQVAPTRDLDNVPAWYNEYAYVQVSEYRTWADVINWALTVNPVATDIKGALAERIAKMKADAGNDKEKYFRAAVKLVQDEVRYMGIEIGEYSHRANRPERVFAQRYGDCKDKSLLLASLLRAGGIEAYMVLVNADIKGKIDQYIPTTDAFNHAVLMAKLNGKEVWVDATMSYQGGTGANIFFPGYGKGLVLKAGNTGLVRSPESKPGKVSIVEQYKIPNEKSKVKLDVKTTYTLDEADDMREKLASNGLGSTEKSYLKYYSKTYPKIEERDSLTVVDDEEKNVLTTYERYNIKDFFKRDSITGKYMAGFYASNVNDELPNFGNQNQTPVTVNYPYSLDYTIKVVLPSGFNISDSKYEIKRDAYYFINNVHVADDTLSLRYRFAYLKDYVPVEKRDEFRQDIKEISDNHLWYNFSYRPDGSDEPMRLNTGMAVFAFILTALLTSLGIWVYRRETPGIVFLYGASFEPIGGLLVLIILFLVVLPLNSLKYWVDHNTFGLDAWDRYLNHSNDFIHKSGLIYNVGSNVALICYAIFCLVLLLNKRDILPKAITGFLICWMTLSIFDCMLASQIYRDGVPADNWEGLGLSVLAALIGIPYFHTSSRVEATFVVPHPPDNFSYEDPVTK